MEKSIEDIKVVAATEHKSLSGQKSISEEGTYSDVKHPLAPTNQTPNANTEASVAQAPKSPTPTTQSPNDMNLGNEKTRKSTASIQNTPTSRPSTALNLGNQARNSTVSTKSTPITQPLNDRNAGNQAPNSTASTQNTPTDKDTPKEAAVNQQKSPVNQQKSPVNQQKSPVNQQQTPADQKQTTVSGKPLPITPLDIDRQREDIMKSLVTTNNPLYNIDVILEKLKNYPVLKIRREGKYYVSTKQVILEKHPRVLRNKRGKVIPIMHRETLGPLENIFIRFCEDYLSISRALTLPMSSQGERHLIWVGRIKAKHIIKFLKGNGCYILNRFPGDVFLKDKQVMGVTLREYMLEHKNRCFWECGAEKNPYAIEDEDEEKQEGVTYKICKHMVRAMRTDAEGCTDMECFNFEKRLCKHFDIFIPEVQSFSSYNALQDFSNRMSTDLKGQLFICKPSYLYKGLGFRFFQKASEFREFYHMTIGKETSRHDFIVQRLIKNPYLHNSRKVDIRAFMLIVTLKHRRVVAFVNPGFCRVASAEYGLRYDSEESSESQENEVPITPKQERQKRAEKLSDNMERLVCTFQTEKEKADRVKRMAENRPYSGKEDRSKELDEVFRSDSLLSKIKKQIKRIANRLASGIERRIWDAYGCYQIFGLDFCVDDNYKVWLLEVNSHAISEVDLLSPTQRVVVPAALMEALGLVVECIYKSSNGLRLRKSPYDEFKDTGFLFAQNYEMVFSTLKRRRTNYKHPRPSHDNGPPFHERIATVDEMIRKTDRRKLAYEAMRKKIADEKNLRKKMRAAKSVEES